MTLDEEPTTEGEAGQRQSPLPTPTRKRIQDMTQEELEELDRAEAIALAQLPIYSEG